MTETGILPGGEGGEQYGAKKVAAAALRMALTENREQETALKQDLAQQGIKAAAVDYGGEFIASVKKIVERALVAAKREGLIHETVSDEGAVAGATREALNQIMPKAVGLNVGGKIGVARWHEHVGVAIFVGIGLLHLDDVGVGMGHRAVPQSD